MITPDEPHASAKSDIEAISTAAKAGTERRDNGSASPTPVRELP